MVLACPCLDVPYAQISKSQKGKFVNDQQTNPTTRQKALIFIALEIFTRKSPFSVAKVACGMCQMWARTGYKSCTGGTSCPTGQVSPSPVGALVSEKDRQHQQFMQGNNKYPPICFWHNDENVYVNMWI